MNVKLPNPVAAYFAADRANGEAVSRCFAENAVVKDEGHAYHGRVAIKQWKEEAAAKYQYTCDPFGCEGIDNTCIVTCRLVGDFPGSPANLRFAFELKGEQIVSLEITP